MLLITSFTVAFVVASKASQVLSQDNDFVVDKESFEDFNGTIATSRRIRKVIPLGFGKGINGKAALYVQEIYKK